jgi:two-component system sensor kinase FixL
VKPSIGSKLSLLTVALVLMTALVVGTVISVGSSKVLINKEIGTFRSESQLKARSLTAHIGGIRSDVLFLAHTPPVAGIARAMAHDGIDPESGRSEQAWRDELAALFKAKMAVEPDYFQLRLMGVANGGEELVRVDRRTGALIRMGAAGLQKKGERDYFRRTIALQPDQVYLSRIDLNREHGQVSVPHLPTLRAATPVFTASGQLFGIVIINLDFGHVLDRIRSSATPGISMFVTNDKGDYLVHPHPGKAFGFDLGSGHRLQQDFPDLAAAFRKPRQHTEMVLNEAIGSSLDLVHLVKVFFDPQQPARFLAVVQSAPRSLVTAGAMQLAEHSLLIGLVLTVAGSLIALQFARLLIRPLKQITHASFLVSSGQHDVLLPTARQDEIGVLSRALQQMLSEIKERESALGDSQSRLKAIVDTAVDGIVTIDEQGIIDSVNPAMEHMFGYSAQEMVGENVKRLMPAQYAEHHDDYLRHYRETGDKQIIGRYRELTGQHKDGTPFPIHLAVNETLIKGRRLFVGVIQDLSPLRSSEERTKRLGRILESSSNEIHIFACPSLQLLEANPAARDNLGYSTEALASMTLFDLFPSDEQLSISGALRGLEENLLNEQQLDSLFLRQDGSVYPVAMRIFASQGKDRSVGVLIAEDITDRQAQLERLRDYAQRLESSNRELQDFAYVASHDLQEPLRKVRAFGDRLKANESARLSERGADYIERMQSAAERMQILINDLLKLSRVTSKARPFESVDLTQIAREVVSDLETRIHDVGGRVAIDPLPVVNADALQMRQLLQNLIGNALKFHRADEPPRVQLSSRLLATTPDAPARYSITVEDNGIGFDSQYLERIFTPFERLHSRQEYEGTGMGLALCKKIVERHGGSITATSQQGIGSRFTITLPVKY